MKTSELTGAALDWAVATANNTPVTIVNGTVFDTALLEMAVDSGAEFQPSTDWAQGGPIIEREGVNTVRCNDLYFPKGNEKGLHWEAYYKAYNRVVTRYGPTPLIAAMRAYVSSKLGDEVEIPKELL